jgi:hypothetical protein
VAAKIQCVIHRYATQIVEAFMDKKANIAKFEQSVFRVKV